MKVKLAFDDLVKQIKHLLKKYTFKKQGNTFYKIENGNWGLISFQKSLRSSASEIFFTINLGTCSYEILKFFNPEIAKKRPIISDCQWEMRLGDFVKKGQDIWWTVNENTNLIELNNEIESLLISYALPSMKQVISDEQLESLWRSKLPNKLNFRQKLYLAVLFKKSGKTYELMSLLKQLETETEGKITASFFNTTKKKLLNDNL